MLKGQKSQLSTAVNSIRQKPSQWRNKSNRLTGRCPLIFSGLWAQLADTCICADCILKWSEGQLCKNAYTWPKGNSITMEQKFLFSFFSKVTHLPLEAKGIPWNHPSEPILHNTHCSLVHLPTASSGNEPDFQEKGEEDMSRRLALGDCSHR